MLKLVYVGPKEFKVLIYRLTMIGIIILIGFNFGSWFYLHTVSTLDHKVQLKNFASILNIYAQKNLELDVDGNKITIKKDELQGWLEPYTRTYSGKKDLRASSKLNDYLIQLATITNIEPVDAKFEFEDDDKVTVFSQSIQGKRLNIPGSTAAIINALLDNKSSVQLIVGVVE